MRVTQKVKKILDWYEGDPPGVKANLARILSSENLAAPARW
jgi:fructose-bisphosphate aldolase, class I